MKKQPKAPDPYAVSAAQTKSNKDTAAYNASLNRINQSSPFGSISYTNSGIDPATGAPIYSQSTELSPMLKNLFDSQIGAQHGISSAITGAIGNLPGAFDPSGISTDKIRDASYSSRVAQMQPQWQEAWRNLEGTMSDRGIPIGSEVWANETGRYGRAQNDSLAQIARQAELDASGEYQRQYGNKMAEHNLPYQNLASLMGVSSPVQNPAFSPFATSSLAGTDVAGNIWNKYNADVQAANARNANVMGGLLGIGKLATGMLI